MGNNGVKAKQLDQLKRCIVQSYGYPQLLMLENLQRVGLLRYSQGKSSWDAIKRNFNLFVEDDKADQDISYVYSGYAPLSIRLLQMTRSLPKGWRSCGDALNLLYGPAQELQQSTEQPGAPPPIVPEPARDPNTPSIALVVFLGGVTYGEIAAVRKLSELEGGRRKFLILTTEFLNAKTLFDSLQCKEVSDQPPIEAKKQKPPEK